MALRDQIEAKLIDQRRLADAGNARHSKTPRLAGVRQKLLQKILCNRLIVRPRAFHKRDRTRQHRAIPRTDAGGEFRRAERHTARCHAIHSDSTGDNLARNRR